MKPNRVKNFLIVFSLIIALFCAIIEKNHDCSGDGCLICLVSSTAYVLANIMLLLTIAPIVIRKLALLLSNAISQYNLSKIEFKSCDSPVRFSTNIVTLDLVTEGIKIQ